MAATLRVGWCGGRRATRLPTRILVGLLPVGCNVVGKTVAQEACFAAILLLSYWVYHLVALDPERGRLEGRAWLPRHANGGGCFVAGWFYDNKH